MKFNHYCSLGDCCIRMFCFREELRYMWVWRLSWESLILLDLMKEGCIFKWNGNTHNWLHFWYHVCTCVSMSVSMCLCGCVYTCEIYCCTFASSALASPEFERRGGEELGSYLAQLMSRAYQHDDCVDLSSLCVSTGQRCWILYIDGLVCDYCMCALLICTCSSNYTNYNVPCEQVIISNTKFASFIVLC